VRSSYAKVIKRWLSPSLANWQQVGDGAHLGEGEEMAKGGNIPTSGSLKSVTDVGVKPESMTDGVR
jgi:hypothetical protein